MIRDVYTKIQREIMKQATAYLEKSLLATFRGLQYVIM